MDRIEQPFACVAEDGTTTARRISQHIAASGLGAPDLRLGTMMERLEEIGERPIGLQEFALLVGEELLMLKRVFLRELVIPDWEEFRRDIRTIYEHVAADRSG